MTNDLAALESRLFDPSDIAARDEFDTIFRALRDVGDVWWSEREQVWIATTHRAVTSILRDAGWSANPTSSTAYARGAASSAASDAVVDLVTKALVWTDPPDHDVLRPLIAPLFNARATERRALLVDRITRDIVGLLPRGTPFDFAELLAQRLPFIVTLDVIGVPLEDEDRLRRPCRDLVWISELQIPASRRPHIARSLVRVMRYMRDLVEVKRAAPTDDLASILALARDAGQIDDEMLYANLLLMLMAGHETTTNLISNVVRALRSGGDASNALLGRPLSKPAFDELMRLHGPVQMVMRVAKTDLELAGRPIRQGDRVIGLLRTANRDPVVFDDPDCAVFDRPVNPHLGFGHALHYCLGSNLARLELGAVLAVVDEELPGLRVMEQPTLRPLVALRAPTELVVVTP